MTGPRIGSLFSGYEGLGMGVEAVLGGEAAWQSEIDPGACKILAHRYPDVPNLGDITAVDWSAVEPVDVITGGSPCQDVSAAGKRAGMRAGTRSGLWASMCDAIDIIRPGLVVWENVRGVLSAGADSSVEPCPICVGDERDSHLRALGRVVGDLAELGYVGRWTGLRAADVGAPHGRFRVFVAAWPAGDSDRPGLEGRISGRRGDERAARPAGVGSAADTRGEAGELGTGLRADGQAGIRGPRLGDRGVPASDTSGRELQRRGVGGVVGGAPGAAEGAAPQREWDGDSARHSGAEAWGRYGDAIRRWERRLGRPAPPPTEAGPKGGHRLSPRAVEFMMGLPAGWVTDVPGLGRNEQLKALGNGVVPQQAAHALRLLLPDAETPPVYETGGAA